MATEGVDAVGITQIVKEARSSVGSFYPRFDGKEDLVRYLTTLPLSAKAASVSWISAAARASAARRWLKQGFP